MLKQMKILIAEDEEINALQLQLQLETLDLCIAGVANTGIMAVQMAEELQPDLVLMDINLEGDMDGVEAAAIIKDKFFLPVIFLTGMSDNSNIERAQGSEPYGYIIKPVNTIILNAAIMTALNRHRLEKQIKFKEEQHQRTLNALSANICVLDETGTIIMVNNAWENFMADNSRDFGEPVIGANYLQICKTIEGENCKQAMEFASGIKEVLLGIRGMFSKEYLYHLSSGKRWFNGIVTPLPDRSSGTIGAVISFENITGLKETELELKEHRNNLEDLVKYRTKELFESEERYKYIIDAITDYVYQVKFDDNKNMTTDYTEGCFNVTGYHSFEFMNNPLLWINIVHEEDRSTVQNFINDLSLGKDSFEKNFNNRIIHKNGSIRWLMNTIVVHKRPDGEMKGYDVITRDISEIKNAEDEIKRLNLNIMNLQEEERQRVAKDLHDSVGQTILAAKINIDTYKQNPERFANRIDIGLDFLIKASQELREIYMNLYPATLNDLGLEMTIRWLISNTMEPAGITSNIDINLTLSPAHNIEINLYRIIQELISNVLKHSGADTFDLNLNSDGRILKLIVKDNGKGIFSESKLNTGYGLSNIKNRISHLNGTISIKMNDPKGTITIITINL